MDGWKQFQIRYRSDVHVYVVGDTDVGAMLSDKLQFVRLTSGRKLGVHWLRIPDGEASSRNFYSQKLDRGWRAL